MWPFSKKAPKGTGRFPAQELPHRFRAHTGAEIESLPLIDAFTLFMDFYQDSRVVDALPVEDDGDMLLFQWGTYDWGQGRNFDINLTRQVIIPDGEDFDIWQLQLDYRYLPEAKNNLAGRGEKWCEAPKDLPSFRSFIQKSPPISVCSHQHVTSVDLCWEHV